MPQSTCPWGTDWYSNPSLCNRVAMPACRAGCPHPALHKGDGFPRQCEHWLEMTRAGRCGTKRDVEDAVPYEMVGGVCMPPTTGRRGRRPLRNVGGVHAPYNGTSGTPPPTNDSFFDSLKAHPGGCALCVFLRIPRCPRCGDAAPRRGCC